MMNKQVQKYLAAIPVDRRARFRQLHELVLSLYPDAQVDLSYRMPTYKSGAGWVALANQKQYISLYTCAAQHIAGFRKKYPSIKTGVGCINFKPTDPVPVAAVRGVIRHAMQQIKPK